MSNNKQSSVQKLAELIRLTNKEVYAELFDEIEQIKVMHKEEIENAHGEEQSKLQDDGSWKRQTAEQYYNETFGE